ncbi:MAG: TetR/AcrR family transcriptional regulator C-terminal ligand-binding domain-containing protein [Mycobacterium sp.]
MADERRPRGRPRDAAVDAAIARATLAEVRETGLRGATMESIAARSGLGKATIYRRAPNLEALVQFVAERVSDICEPADTGDLRKDLLSVFEYHQREYQAGPAAVVITTFMAEAARDGRIRELVTRLVEERRAAAVEALKRAERRGELCPGADIEMVVDMIAGACNFRSMFRAKPVSVAFIRGVVDHAVRGVEKTAVATGDE